MSSILPGFVTLVALFGTLSAAAADLGKVSFEQETGLMVIDWGSQRGIIDGEDTPIDLYAAASNNRPKDVPPSPLIVGLEKYFASRKGDLLKRDLIGNVQKIATFLNIGSDLMSGSSNPVIAKFYSSSRLTVLVLPDFHQSQIPTDTEKGKNGHALHIEQAKWLFEFLELALQKKKRILFLLEGGASTLYKYYETVSTENKLDRSRLLEKLIQGRPQMISQEMGEVYRGIIETKFIDESDLFNDWVLRHFTYILTIKSKAVSWNDTREHISKVYPDVISSLTEERFNKLKDLNGDQQLNGLEESIDRRSAKMAEQAISASRDSSTDVTVVRIGASHVGKFLEILRINGINHIVLSPNFPQ